MFLLHNDLSSVISIHHRCHFALHDPDALTVDIEQAIIPVILFTVLFANQIMICSRSAAHMSLVLSFLLNPRAMAVDFEQIIVPVLLYLALFVN